MKVWRREQHSALSARLTFPGLLIQGLVSLALQRDQSEVDALPLQQLIVFAPLHRPAVLEAHYDVGIFDRGESMCNGNGGTTHADLRQIAQYTHVRVCVCERDWLISDCRQVPNSWRQSEIMWTNAALHLSIH